MTTEPTYKRNQVNQALWQTATHLKGAEGDPPKAFLTRVKRLLEIDRQNPTDEGIYAFSDEKPGGKGVDMQFTAFNTFCLMLGLNLLDIGFKQSEIVFLLQHIQNDLRPEYDWVQSHPPKLQSLAGKHPTVPSYQRGTGKPAADFNIFILIKKVEMFEIYPLLKDKLPIRQPVIAEPIICRGVEALRDTVWQNKIDNHLLLEISRVAHLIPAMLADAPARARGRD